MCLLGKSVEFQRSKGMMAATSRRLPKSDQGKGEGEGSQKEYCDA
jgi:hypothetical protein